MVTSGDKKTLEALRARLAREAATAKSDSETRKRLQRGELDIQPYNFDLKRIVQFRYRVRNVLMSITRKTIKDARIAEIRNEIINSEKLKAHFEDNPTDLDALQHDIVLKPQAVNKALAKIPSYLLSSTELQMLHKEADAIAVRKNKGIKRREQGGKRGKRKGRDKRRVKGNPLKRKRNRKR